MPDTLSIYFPLPPPFLALLAPPCCPKELIKSSRFASSSSEKPLSSKPASTAFSFSSVFLLLASVVSAASVEGVGSLPASNPRPKRALNPANRPASSSSTFSKSLELGLHNGAFCVSLVDLYTGKGDVVHIVKALPSESVTNCVKV